ncbi:MAG: hypothetical protein IJU92_04150 [Spirochaetaceae bacterium]|nr:hypothetical protein [Spirochaetaceae bacterium]
MATQEEKTLYNHRLEKYQQEIDRLLTREKSVLSLAKKDEATGSYKLLILAEDMIYLATIYMAKQKLSVAILKSKNEDALNEARKALYKSIIYLEEVVSNEIDVPFSDYKDKLAKIENFSLKDRYYLIKKLGLAIDLVLDAYGDNTKWRWSFVELKARFATVAKNIVDLKDATENGLDPHSPDYETAVFHLRLAKKLLLQAADQYREKYEMATGESTSEDFLRAITYLNALRRLHLILNERSDAEEIKHKIDIWQAKLESDAKKRKEKQRRRAIGAAT